MRPTDQEMIAFDRMVGCLLTIPKRRVLATLLKATQGGTRVC